MTMMRIAVPSDLVVPLVAIIHDKLGEPLQSNRPGRDLGEAPTRL